MLRGGAREYGRPWAPAPALARLQELPMHALAQEAATTGQESHATRRIFDPSVLWILLWSMSPSDQPRNERNGFHSKRCNWFHRLQVSQRSCARHASAVPRHARQAGTLVATSTTGALTRARKSTKYCGSRAKSRQSVACRHISSLQGCAHGPVKSLCRWACDADQLSKCMNCAVGPKASRSCQSAQHLDRHGQYTVPMLGTGAVHMKREAARLSSRVASSVGARSSV